MDIFTILIVGFIVVTLGSMLLQDRSDKKKGWPQRPVGGPFEPRGNMQRWEANVADVEYQRELAEERREAEEVERLADRVAESLRQRGYQPTPDVHTTDVHTTDVHTTPALVGKERLHFGPYDQQFTMVAQDKKKINVPAGVPIDRQHRYERNIDAIMVWKGCANGTLPQVRSVVKIGKNHGCYFCGGSDARSQIEVRTDVLQWLCDDHLRTVASAAQG